MKHNKEKESKELELHADFLEDFSKLLKRYNAEFDIEFRSEGWSHKDVPVIDFNHTEERGYSQLVLPSYID